MPLAANINIADRDAYASLGARFTESREFPRDFDARTRKITRFTRFPPRNLYTRGESNSTNRNR